MPILTSLALSSVAAMTFTNLAKARRRGKVKRRSTLDLIRRRSEIKTSTKRETRMSDTEAEAAHQQRIAIGASALTGLGALAHSAIGLIGLPLLIYNYVYVMRKIWHAHQKRQKIVLVVFESLGSSLLVLTGSFFTASLYFTGVFSANRLIGKTEREAHSDFSRIFGELSDNVWLVKQGIQIETPLIDVKTGDIIVIHAGDTVPVDGHVLTGEGTVDQHLLTGESQPVEKKSGDPVLTSTLLISGTLQIRVEKQGDETVTGQIADVLEHAATFKERVQSRGDRTVEKGASRILLTSGVALPFIGINQVLPLTWSGFGYQMRLAAPLMVLNYLRIASRKGILIKDGRALETMAKIDTVIFDKTGTLTEEVPQVEQVVACDGFSPQQLLLWAASAEQRQKHPIAHAICAHAAKNDLRLLELISSDYAIGHGLRAELGPGLHQPTPPQVVLIGSLRYIRSQHIDVPDEIAALQKHVGEKGHSVVYLAGDDGTLFGAIELRPNLRPGAKNAIGALHEMNITTCIISGDQERPTRTLAAELGIERYFAEALPTDKASIVAALQEQGHKICFIGDGINDSVALQKANVAISLQGAATIAKDTADVVLMTRDLMYLPYLVDTSKELSRRMDHSETLNNVTGVTCVCGVLLFGMGLGGAIALYSGGLVVNLSNAMMPLLKRRER